MTEIIPFGDNALLINFDQIISEAVNEKVHSLNHILLNHQREIGIKYTIPAYCSITVVFKSSDTSFEVLSTKIKEVWANDQIKSKEKLATRLHNIPVCYDEEFCLDMDEVSNQTGLSRDEIKAYHMCKLYRVFMLGFTPGFPYMGLLEKHLFCNRKETPRLKVPEGSVGLAGKQTGVYPSASPGGWQIIGRTPIPLLDGSNENPFLFSPGDQVKFYEIAKGEFDSLKYNRSNGIGD